MKIKKWLLRRAEKKNLLIDNGDYIRGCEWNVAKMNPIEYLLCKFIFWGWGFGTCFKDAWNAIKEGLWGLAQFLTVPFIPLLMVYVAIAKPIKARISVKREETRKKVS